MDSASRMRTSYKKNRPFDFKLIDLVEPNPVLYKRQLGLSNYEIMKAKNMLWDKIAAQMGREMEFCLMRWNNLRYQFRKELRRSIELCPKLGTIRGSTWPYLERLRFLEEIPPNKPKSVVKKEAKTASIDQEKNDYQEVSDYSDCEMELVVANVNQQPQNDEPIVQQSQLPQQQQQIHYVDTEGYTIIEEVSESSNDIIEEETVYEDAEDDSIKKFSPKNIEMSANNMRRMDELLGDIQGEQRRRVERRILAFALKCQLRALMNQSVDDLLI